MAAYDNTTLFNRFKFGGTKGGAHERRVTTIALQVHELSKQLVAFFPASADRDTVLADLDNVMTHVNSISSGIGG